MSPAAAAIRVSSIVAWLVDGVPQFGVVDGRQGDRIFVRRIDGTRAERERRYPKAAAEVVQLFSADQLVEVLTMRARKVLERLG